MPQLNKFKENKKEKQKKEPAFYTVKKLPSLLKKKYTQKSFNKKILKKLFIAADKEYISSLFTENSKTKKGVPLLSISEDKQFDKPSYLRLKKLAKEIKNQKGRVKLLPLFAVLVFLAAIIVFTLCFKNKVIKSVIINTVQNSTETRCDIDYLNFSLFDATFIMKGFAIADKNDPMQNAVSIEKIDIDFNLLELLKSRFIANELSVIGFNLNTPRTVSGSLSNYELKKIHDAKAKKAEKEALKAAKKAQKKKEKESKPESKFVTNLKGKANASVDNVKNSLTEIAAPYDPQVLLTNMYNSLQTPGMSSTVEKEIKECLDKYSNFPQELEADVKKGSDVLNSVQTINIEEIKQNPLKVKDTIETLTKAYNDTMAIKNDAEKKINNVQKDMDKYLALSNDIQKAISKDSKYIKTEVNKITSITFDDGTKFISDNFTTILCNLLGQYYPYYEKVLDYVTKLKENKNAKTKKEPKKSRRLSGRNIYYKADPNPKLWIKKIAGSGQGLSFEVNNITDDMDKTDKATNGKFSLTLKGVNHNADFNVDARTKTENALVSVNYGCEKVPVSISTATLGDVPGIPQIDSAVGKFSCKLDVFDSENFNAVGTADLEDLKLSVKFFEPAYISKIYSNVMSGINTMNSRFTIENTDAKGLDIGLKSDIDKVFVNSFKKEMNNELDLIKKQVEQELVDKLNDLTKGALGEVQNLEDLKKKIDDEKAKIENIPKEIQKQIDNLKKFSQDAVDEAAKKLEAEAAAKKAELEKQAQAELDKKKKEAEAEAERLKQQAAAEAERVRKEAEEAAKKKAQEEAKKALKKLF